MDALYPNCERPLKNRPARKTKCPYCSRFIYVRQGKLIGDGPGVPQLLPAPKTKEKIHPFVWGFCLFALVSACCGIGLVNLTGGGSSQTPPMTEQDQDRSAAANVSEATNTPRPTNTPKPPPTSTPTPTEIDTSTPEKAIDTATPKKPTDTPTPSAPIVEVERSVNLRSGPGTAYDVVGALSPEQSFNIIGGNADYSWWQIAVDDKPVWVAASVVKASNVDQEIEVVEAPPPPTSTITPTMPLPTPSPTPMLLPTLTPASFSPAPQPAGGGCCKICTTGKACGNSCISAGKNCHQPPGCACNG